MLTPDFQSEYAVSEFAMMVSGSDPEDIIGIFVGSSPIDMAGLWVESDSWREISRYYRVEEIASLRVLVTNMLTD